MEHCVLTSSLSTTAVALLLLSSGALTASSAPVSLSRAGAETAPAANDQQSFVLGKDHFRRRIAA